VNTTLQVEPQKPLSEHRQVPQEESLQTKSEKIQAVTDIPPKITEINDAGQTVTPRPKRSFKATPEVRRAIFMALGGLALLFCILMVFTQGLYNRIHFLIPVLTLGYAIFYQFFPHDWEKERYFMSHLHLGTTLIIGFMFVAPLNISKANLCSDGDWGRIIDINSMAYFTIDSLVLIDTIWITHHSLSIGCAIFGIAGTRQVVGGAIYCWYAEIGGLLYHISRMWADSKIVRQVFLVCYLGSRLVMLWIATVSFRCTYDQFNKAGINPDFFVDATLTCFTTGVALVNLKFLYTNYLNYVKKFGSKKKTE